MNNEIKEILDFLKDKDDYIEEYGYEYKRISLEDTKILLDYITNLQEIADVYNRKYREVKMLKEQLLYEKENTKVYKSRCEKAIPMLKELNIKLKDILKIGIDIKEISNIEKVLQGVGKDE